MESVNVRYKEIEASVFEGGHVFNACLYTNMVFKATKGMPSGRRKAPFSGKAKKVQLQAKKDRKRGGTVIAKADSSTDWRESQSQHRGTDGSDDEDVNKAKVVQLNKQPAAKGSDVNRYKLHFFKLSKDEIEEKKRIAQAPYTSIEPKDLEVDGSQIFPPDMDIPKRPRWSYSMSKDEVEIREARYFKEYVQRLEATFGSDQLANMELNLETWRQLWRVLEMSNVVLVIADIRFTALMFPPSLYHFVKEELGKHLIFVLHKIDLVPPPLVLAWKKYLQTRFPGVQIICFSTFPRTTDGDGGKNRPRGRLKWKMATKCASKLCEACETLIPGIDFSQWKAKILEDEAFCLGGPGKDSSEDASDCEVENILEEDSNISPMDVPGVLTIGCVGFPNVGKSSLINALMGFKVVSVSRTPGHTKHFQTIYLTNNVRLCDCPGLVFPSSAARHLQVLMGSYPIAQLQEPYSAVQFLAEALPIVKMLRLVHPDHEGNAPYNPDRYEWCAWDVCDAWAEKRGYRTKKAARLDTYRAANHILRLALEGKICLCLYPPGYNKSKSEFETSPELQEIHSCYPPSFFSSLEVSAHTNKSKEEAESDISDDEDEGGDETTGGSVGDDDDDDEEDDEPGSFNKFAFLSEQSV